MNTNLTPKEDSIVRLKMTGLERKEIAEKMKSSIETVCTHFKHVYEKTDTHNEIELYNWYCETILHINIRKMLIVCFLIGILLPSIFTHNSDVQRASRSARTTARTASRTIRRNNTDFLFN